MLRSLVGSEMCIRDSNKSALIEKKTVLFTTVPSHFGANNLEIVHTYTHLPVWDTFLAIINPSYQKLPFHVFLLSKTFKTIRKNAYLKFFFQRFLNVYCSIAKFRLRRTLRGKRLTAALREPSGALRPPEGCATRLRHLLHPVSYTHLTLPTILLV